MTLNNTGKGTDAEPVAGILATVQFQRRDLMTLPKLDLVQRVMAVRMGVFQRFLRIW